MAKETDTPKDEGLQGNEKIEKAILELQKEPTPELLAHVLTVIRRRMKEGGQALLSVEPHDHAGSYAAFDYHRGRERRTLISYFTWPDYDAAHNQLRLRIAWVMMLREKKKIA